MGLLTLLFLGWPWIHLNISLFSSVDVDSPSKQEQVCIFGLDYALGSACGADNEWHF